MTQEEEPIANHEGYPFHRHDSKFNPRLIVELEKVVEVNIRILIESIR